MATTVRISNPIVVNGIQWYAGDVVLVDDSLALRLRNSGYATLLGEGGVPDTTGDVLPQYVLDRELAAYGYVTSSEVTAQLTAALAAYKPSGGVLLLDTDGTPYFTLTTGGGGGGAAGFGLDSDGVPFYDGTSLDSDGVPYFDGTAAGTGFDSDGVPFYA